MKEMEYSPSIIFLETTNACDYVCRHCRANSQRFQDDTDLSIDEIRGLISSFERFNERPEIVLTGGNPLMRKDIGSIMEVVHEFGFPMSLSPAASELLSDDFLKFASGLGIKSISLSVDGEKGKSHEWLRNSTWSYDKTVHLLKEIEDFGISSQINTTVFRDNVMELPHIAELVKNLDVSAWEVFFLIRTGRASLLSEVTPQDYMQIVNWLRDLRELGINVRTVEAPLFRVIDSIRMLSPKILVGQTYDKLKARTFDLVERIKAEKKGNSERETKEFHKFNGTLFISHEGKVYLSGLIPYELGDIRREKLESIISRNSAFLNYRSGNLLEGKCGSCNFKKICGGSRARAYSLTGNPFAEDPSCLYNSSDVMEKVSQHTLN